MVAEKGPDILAKLMEPSSTALDPVDIMWRESSMALRWCASCRSRRKRETRTDSILFTKMSGNVSTEGRHHTYGLRNTITMLLPPRSSICDALEHVIRVGRDYTHGKHREEEVQGVQEYEGSVCSE